MGVVYGVLVAACGVVGALGVALLLAPAGQARLRGWLRRAGAAHDDGAVLAVQAAVGRSTIAAAGLLVVVWLAFLALGLKAVGLALALPLAGLLAVLVPVGGGVQRRAVLVGGPRPAGRVGQLVGLAVAGVAVAAALLGVRAHAFAPGQRLSGVGIDASTVLPEVEIYTLPVLAAVAVAVPVLVAVVWAVLERRSGLSGATVDVDGLVRGHQRRLVWHAAVAAELVLAAVLVRVAPLLTTPPGSGTAENAQLVEAAGVAALGVVLIALAVTVRGATYSSNATAERLSPAVAPVATR